MIKILYNLQLSAIDKTTKEFLIFKDSNFSVFYNIANSFNKFFKDEFEFICLIPAETSASILSRDYNLPNVVYVPIAMNCKDLYSLRFNWDAKRMTDLVLEYKPDIIWENQPSLVNNWRAILTWHKLVNEIKIITYNHWIDVDRYSKVERESLYGIRQSEAAMLSDLYLCNSLEARNQIWEMIEENLSIKRYTPIVNVYSLAPFIDDEHTYEILRSARINETNKIKIVYNHRLSEFPYYKDGFNLFMKVIEELKKDNDLNGFSIRIIFTDASEKLQSREELPVKDSPNIRLELRKGMNKAAYYNFLVSCDIGVGTFTPNGGCWSISLAETILMKIATIVPNHSGYKEMVPSNYPLLVIPTVEDVTGNLKKLILNQSFRENCIIEAYNYYVEHYSSEKLTKYLRSLILEKVLLR